jgi:hypothetical protein
MLSRAGEASRRIWIKSCGHQHYSVCQQVKSPRGSYNLNRPFRRNASWKTTLNSLGWMNQKNEGFGNVPDNEEDAIRAAILDKALKGRQPSDLMLRCKFLHTTLVRSPNDRFRM